MHISCSGFFSGSSTSKPEMFPCRSLCLELLHPRENIGKGILVCGTSEGMMNDFTHHDLKKHFG